MISIVERSRARFGFPNSARVAAGLVGGLTVVAAAFSFDAVFIDRDHLWVALAAALGALVVAIGAKTLGFAPVVVLVSHLVVFFLVGGIGLFWTETLYGLPTAASLRGVATGVTGGFRDLLETPTPVAGQSELLVPVAGLVWLACGLTTEIVLRAVRPVLGALVLGTTVLVAVVVATGRADRPLLGVALAVLLLVFVGITASIGPDDAVTLLQLGDAPVRRAAWPILAAVAVAVGAATVGANFVTLLPFTNESDRFDVRHHLLPPVEPPAQDLSPIVRTKSQLNEDPPALVFTAEFTGPVPSGPLLFHAAALDSYDGVLWSSNRLYRRTAAVLPHDDLGIGDVASFRVRLTSDYPYDYLPLLGDPLSTTLANGGFDEATDTLIAPQGTRPNFEATSRVLPRDELLLDDVNAADGSGFEAFLVLPEFVPDEIREFVTEVVGDASTAGEQLVQLEARMTDGSFGYDTTGPSGHSLAAIETYLGLRPTSDGSTGSGYAEQAAAAFAVAARLEGIPARVVVGYRVDPAQVEGSTVEVTTADAHVWVEAALDELGWVAFDPIIRGERTIDPPPPPSVQFTPDADEPVTQPTAAQPATPAPVAADSFWARFGVLRFIGLLLVLVIVGIPIAKVIRRRRRFGRGDPSRRVMGAWLEVRDALVENGLAVSPAMTPAEVIRSARSHGLMVADDPAGDRLVRLVQWAQFRPEDLTVDDGALAVQLERTIGSSLSHRRSMVRRVLAWVDPRPVLGSAVQRRGRLGWSTDHDPFDASPFDPYAVRPVQANERATSVDSPVLDLRETVPSPELGARNLPDR